MDDPGPCRLRPRTLALPLLLCLTLLVTATAPAQDAKDRPLLRWGGDVTGGEPYIIENPGGEPTGFEGDLIRHVADKLGMTAKFVQNDWDQLPLLLEKKGVSVVLNGYEWSAERERAMISTVPYYSYRLRLIVPKSSAVKDWPDLAKKGTRVGVLKDSAADRYVREHYPDAEVVGLGTEGTTGILKLLEEGRQFDATVQDDVVVSAYLDGKKMFPKLHAVGEAIPAAKHSFYVMFLRREDADLRDRINAVLRDATQDGTLRRIYEKYGVRSGQDAELAEAAKSWPPEEAAKEWSLVAIALDLGRAALVTVALTLLSMPLAMAIGVVTAVGRLYGPWWVRVPSAVYVEIVRGTPILFQVIVIFYFLPRLVGVELPAFWAGVVGLAVNYGAYESENYRAGLLAIPEGQTEAALALGMTRSTVIWRIVLPQAVRLVVPPVTNDFINLFKDTSICSVIAVTELLARYRHWSVADPGLAMYALTLTALLYLLMSYPLSLLARKLEASREEEEDAPA